MPPKGSKKATGKPAATPPTPPTFGLSWSNLSEVQKMYDLTEKEAVAALEEVLGPRPKDFWVLR
mgnify:CR=1 FL=1